MVSIGTRKPNQKQQQIRILKQRIKQLETEIEQLKKDRIDPKEAVAVMFDIAEKLQKSARSANKKADVYIVPDNAGDSIEIHLCRREKQVLKLLVAGKSNKEIADELKLSTGYVKNLVKKTFRKTKLSDRTQLAVFAIKYGLVDLNEITIQPGNNHPANIIGQKAD
jgi:DNA-binding NarL/FixJ family response regulator